MLGYPQRNNKFREEEKCFIVVVAVLLQLANDVISGTGLEMLKYLNHTTSVYCSSGHQVDLWRRNYRRSDYEEATTLAAL